MPHKPAEYDKPTLYAVRAFFEGKANEGQQIMVRDFILHNVCQVEGMSYRPGGHEADRATAFAEGKRFVANQLRKMLNPITLAALERAEQRASVPKRQKRQPEA